MKFESLELHYSTVGYFFLLQINNISILRLNMNITTWVFYEKGHKAPYRIWTDDLRLTMALLYHWVKRAVWFNYWMSN